MKKVLIILALFFVSVSLVSAVKLYSASVYSVDEVLVKVKPGYSDNIKVRGTVGDLRMVDEEIRFNLISSNGAKKLPVLLEKTKTSEVKEGKEIIVKGRFTVEQVFVGREVN